MIVSHSSKTKSKITAKSKEAVHKIFVEADADKDGALSLEEFCAFSKLMSASLKKKYGGAYELTEVQAVARHSAYDLNKDHKLTEKEFWACMELRE